MSLLEVEAALNEGRPSQVKVVRRFLITSGHSSEVMIRCAHLISVRAGHKCRSNHAHEGCGRFYASFSPEAPERDFQCKQLTSHYSIFPSKSQRQQQQPPPMKPSQLSSQAEIPSIQLVKASVNAQTTIRKEQEQLQRSPPPKPTKKHFISKKSMAFMNC